MNCLDAASLRAHPEFQFHFDFAMYWIPSEQAREFDCWLRLPIRNRKLLSASAIDHFGRVSKIPMEADASLVYESFDALLRQLKEGGEDIDRLTLWFASQNEGLPDLGMRPSAGDLWTRALRSWARTESLDLLAEMYGIDRRFATSYHGDVLDPYDHLYPLKRQAHEQWKSAARQLGEFDQLVADVYFDEVRGSPASFLFPFVERRLHREWWRTARSLLNRDQIQGLTEEFVQHVTTTDIPEVIPWEHLFAMDEAFTIDLFPVFDEVAGDGRE